MSDQHDTTARPDWACQLHSAPRRVGAWVPADPAYKTCSSCLDRLRDDLADISRRYLMLDARPGASGEHGSRGAPGFGSRSPASDHIIAMRDPRSDQLARMWRGGNGTQHAETERPVRSVPTTLADLAWFIAEERNLDGPTDDTVHGLVRWIDAHLDWLTRRADVAEHVHPVRELVAQLKPVTGDPGRRHIGLCPNTVTGPDDTTRECRAKLYAPLRGDRIECRLCGREWPRAEWLRLGLMLEQAS